MKLKVGDKVRVIETTGLNATSNCGIGTVLTIDSLKGITAERPIVAINSEGKIAGYFNEKALELIEPKKTKNQRITALEKEVAELKKILNEIQNGPKTMRDTMNELLSEPSTTDDIIEFEGNQYRKVDREARKGDVVIFKDGIKPVDWITIGKPYKATEGVDDCEKGEFIGDICGEFPIYRYDDFNRTRETVDVYELIKQELTPNQQRAEIIEKAKKFVEEQKDEDGDIQIEGWYSCTPEWIVDIEKRTLVVLLKGYQSKNLRAKGISKCHPNDVFNEHIGKAIALGRALGIDVSEFENAVQPNEIVVGMVIKGNESENRFYRKSRKFTLTSETDYGGFYYKEASKYSGEPSNDYILSFQFGDILNDTNAQYEEVK